MNAHGAIVKAQGRVKFCPVGLQIPAAERAALFCHIGDSGQDAGDYSIKMMFEDPPHSGFGGRNPILLSGDQGLVNTFLDRYKIDAYQGIYDFMRQEYIAGNMSTAVYDELFENLRSVPGIGNDFKKLAITSSKLDGLASKGSASLLQKMPYKQFIKVFAVLEVFKQALGPAGDAYAATMTAIEAGHPEIAQQLWAKLAGDLAVGAASGTFETFESQS